MFKNITIKTRLIFVIGFLAIELIAGFAVGIINLDKANATLGSIFNDRLMAMGRLSQVERAVMQNQTLVARAAQPGADLDALLAQLAKNSATIERSWGEYLKTKSTPLEQQQAQAFVVARSAFLEQGLNPAVKALRSGDMDAAQAVIYGPVATLALPVNETMAALVRTQIDVASTEYKASEAAEKMVRIVCITGLIGGLGLALVLGWLLVRGIVRPLEEAVRIAGAVAQGDLTQTIDVRSNDETGRLMAALHDMNSALIGIVSRVRSGTDTIATASSEIADGNLDLSSRTEQQASALEETASSMEELTSTVKQNADNARQANVLAGSASQIAGKGGAVVEQVVQTMSDINASSKKIVEIISVIDGIAFQTNILALNAAVEAARAGEQGRGFAVVAGEVRNLAQRSAAAAKEIKGLIDDSVRKVQHGSTLVDQAGTTMTEIVASVSRVTDIMAEISAASQEQTAGIEQVNAAIVQMDQTTQQNAALVEEASAAAQSLQQESESLARTVGAFQIGAGAAPVRSRQVVLATSAPAPRSKAERVRVSAGDGWEQF